MKDLDGIYLLKKSNKVGSTSDLLEKALRIKNFIIQIFVKVKFFYFF